MIKYKCSNYSSGTTKKTSQRLIIFVVDKALYFWNTFFEYAVEWEPVLKEIFEK